ncbi:hypothetical protein CSUNSWCD_1350 [Campylobacter showae CSUNSWCD]|uniref:Uncharacterized protein n=1 Tax=Campylobacter showae CSUNSWCD TaxID=1244083 RepID=M5IRV5_9BACT|nr:hypothetical protein CSUNSWCD_1350 [Campylobacter showae CSUNSWCD]
MGRYLNLTQKTAANLASVTAANLTPPGFRRQIYDSYLLKG